MPRQASTPFPGVFTTHQYDDAIRNLTTDELRRELELDRWLALEVADHAPSRQYVERMVDGIARELERRQKLLRMRPGDPLAPRWPARPDLRERFEAMKDAWPLERFCREVLLCDLQPVANGELLGHCPLPGHDDSSPSFRVYPDGHAHCFGCGRGGDVISLTRVFFDLGRNYEALTMLESMTTGFGRAA